MTNPTSIPHAIRIKTHIFATANGLYRDDQRFVLRDHGPATTSWVQIFVLRLLRQNIYSIAEIFSLYVQWKQRIPRFGSPVFLFIISCGTIESAKNISTQEFSITNCFRDSSTLVLIVKSLIYRTSQKAKEKTTNDDYVDK